MIKEEQSPGHCKVPARLTCSETYWRTPKEVLSVIRIALGGIKLDPCSDHENWTEADHFSTDEGLLIPWEDGTFVNPPYGDSLPIWCEKVRHEAERGLAIVVLVPGNRFSNNYYQDDLFPNLKMLVHARGRIQFVDRANNPQPHNMYGSSFFCYGKRDYSIMRVFGHLMRPA